MAHAFAVTETNVRDGLPISMLAQIGVSLRVSTPELVDWLHISPRTWARRKQSGRFDTLESDRVARLVRLVRRSIEVLGGEDEARVWLTTPARSLDRRTPFRVASTEVGAESVFQLLGRLEHGVFS